MLITAEIRWFWPDDASTSRLDWFVSSQRHGGPPAEPAARVDRYLVDGVQPELGIKLRGGRSGVEIKGLVDARAAVLSSPPFDGAIEIWSKWWTVDIGLDAGRTVEVEKRRWVRAFDSTGPKPVEVSELVPAWYLGTAEMPARGCNVEVTRVAGPEGEVWWTIGFEAYGALSTVVEDLVAVAGVMAVRRPPEMSDAVCQSYPAWLGSIVDQGA